MEEDDDNDIKNNIFKYPAARQRTFFTSPPSTVSNTCKGERLPEVEKVRCASSIMTGNVKAFGEGRETYVMGVFKRKKQAICKSA
jgi:hypothetical protein